MTGEDHRRQFVVMNKTRQRAPIPFIFIQPWISSSPSSSLQQVVVMFFFYPSIVLRDSEKRKKKKSCCHDAMWNSISPVNAITTTE